MTALRRLLAQRHLVLLIVAAALAMKLLVPGGYMLSAEHGRLAIVLCPGVVPAPQPAAMAGMHGAEGHHADRSHGEREPHGQVEMPCAFASLAHQALGAADPVLLAAAIRYIVAHGTAPVRAPAFASVAHLRPPLRGPPASL